MCHRRAVLGLSLVAIGCVPAAAPGPPRPAPIAMAAEPAAPPEPDPPTEPFDAVSARQRIPRSRFDQIGDDETRTSIERLVDEARAVVASRSFRLHLAAAPALYPSASEPPIGGAEALRIYLGLDPAAQLYPTSYRSGHGYGMGPRVTALTRLDAEGAVAVTTLAPRTIQAAAAGPGSGGEIEPYACAVATIAHEWSHAVVAPGRLSESRFDDRDRERAPGPLFSHAVGAVAQCAYLGLHGYPVEERFDACVAGAAFAASCEAGWARRAFGRR